MLLCPTFCMHQCYHIILPRDGQLGSWRATVLQSLAQPQSVIKHTEKSKVCTQIYILPNNIVCKKQYVGRLHTTHIHTL